MTIYTEWAVFAGGFDAATTVNATTGIPSDSNDLTSRTKTIVVDHQIMFGQVGNASCSVTFDNTDGALTPGGGGTFSATDWFQQPLFIAPKADTSDPPGFVAQDPGTTNLPTNVPYFVGPITDVDHTDDGFTSTVTFKAVDWLSYMARLTYTSAWSATDERLPAVMLDALPLASGSFPKWGASLLVKLPLARADEEWEHLTQSGAVGDYAGDAVARAIAADGGIMFAGFTSFAGGTTTVIYYQDGIERRRLAKNPSTAVELVFEEADNLGTTDLPFRNLDVGFNNERIITHAEVTREGGSSQSSAADATAAKYGPRSITVGNTPHVDDTAASDLATFYTSRFDQVVFAPRSLEVTGAMIQNYCNDAAIDVVKHLMASNTYEWGALFGETKVTWTGAGASSQTAAVLPFRTQMVATPEDWTMRLTFRDATNFGGFILDSNEQGILDTNRLT